MMMKLVIATTSPYRIEAMNLIGIPFEAKGSDVEEYFEGRPSAPGELVLCLSRLKAEAVAKGCIDSLVVGMDSVAFFDGAILEKPRSVDEAFSRLKNMSGKTHEFYTGVTMIDTRNGNVQQKVVITSVELRRVSDDEIRRYLEQDPRYRTYALGYDPLGSLSCSFVKRIDGDPQNILRGIPLATVIPMIQEVMK